MPIHDLVRRYPPIRKLSTAYYYYRENRWRIHPRFRSRQAAPEIDRPIFLLGTQGGGLTFTSRILRRHPSAVSVSGNCHYWAGPDEMQNVLDGALPDPLSWQKLALPGFPNPDHNWVYACNAYLPHYRRTAADASELVEQRFKELLRGILRMNAPDAAGAPGRLVDKSQSFTVKVGLIDRLLSDCRPVFVLLTRDPFAMCWRAVTRDLIVSNLPQAEEQKLEVAVQHWRNSMQAALDDAAIANLRWWRFEDLLAAPERVVGEICAFAGLPYRPEILPRADDRIPWGSMFDAFDTSKWYPLRPQVSDRYLREIPGWAIDRVQAECGALCERFGYSKPAPAR